MSDALTDKLSAIVGRNGVVADGERSKYLTDARDWVHGDARAVVLPKSTDEVAAVVRLAAAEGIKIVPQGGNTSMCYGSVPHVGEAGIVINLSRMNAIREIDREGSVAVVDAGCILATLHAAAAEVDRSFPMHLGSEGSAQIGGLIAANAGGTGAVRYGPMRDLVFGVEVVLANGEVISDLSALRKDNRGYNLNHLFIGAEGTLGIVTGAALKLHPVMRADAAAFVSVESPAAALNLLGRVQEQFATAVNAFELLSGNQIALCEEFMEGVTSPFTEGLPEWAILIELADPDPAAPLRERLEEFLGSELEAERILDAVVAQSGKQAESFWSLRHAVTEANMRAGFGATLDASVRVSMVPAFLAKATEALATHFPDAMPVVVSHLGDGNVHFIALFRFDREGPDRDPKKTAEAVLQLGNRVAVEMGGSFSAEHGIGRKLTGELQRLTAPERYEAMLAIKRLFDPGNLMNPGVLFPADLV